MLKRLYDSRGRHIANQLNDQLHSPQGPNVGHYLRPQDIFIDMQGRYLGEIFQGDRLLANRYSPHCDTDYGVYGNYGDLGDHGNPGNVGGIGLPGGYEDVDPAKLR